MFAGIIKTKQARRARRGWASAGFTLIELMIVITIMLILVGMAAVRYDRSVQHSKEAALHHDLSVLRQAIEQYTLDKEQAPQSLDDLVSAGYLRAVQDDADSDSWGGQDVFDVYTKSTGTGLNGTKYSNW